MFSLRANVGTHRAGSVLLHMYLSCCPTGFILMGLVAVSVSSELFFIERTVDLATKDGIKG